MKRLQAIGRNAAERLNEQLRGKRSVNLSHEAAAVRGDEATLKIQRINNTLKKSNSD